MKKDEVELAKDLLLEYLKKNKLRVNNKRFLILEYIYSLNTHFSVDELYNILFDDGVEVSKATLYNTVNLLLEAKLLIKIQLSTEAYYRKMTQDKNLQIYVCTLCDSIREFKDSSIRVAIQTKRVTRFQQSNYFLCVYGTCNKCLKNKK